MDNATHEAPAAHGETTHATTQAHGGGHEPAPAVFGLDATGWVSLAMAVFIAVLIWKKVPAAIAGALDKQIAGIRTQLDEAAKLRAEAEALRAEYDARLASAQKDADALRARADEEARLVIEEAKANADALVARRMKMADDKIAAAERTAIADIRAKAVSAAASAAATLIVQSHDAKADKAMIDGTIGSLGTVN